MKRIIIFASGSGSNAENIVRYFQQTKSAEVILIATNNSKAFVVERAKRLNIPVKIFNKKEFYEDNNFLHFLQNQKPDVIVLAGFLWLIPEKYLKGFPNKIVNIHPALLPKYGGKGMYGDHVHEAVRNSGDTESGITIHLLNEKFDEGKILFQVKSKIHSTDTVETIAEKVHTLEYEYYPKEIEKFLEKN
jgi:phosphoribosylglycinamide formyltransferase 1